MELRSEVSRVEGVAGVFAGLYKLKESVAIYVPSTVNATEAVDSKSMVGYVVSELTRLFGGTTTTKGQGSWMSDEHGVILEDVTIVTACTEALTEEKAQKVLALAQYVREAMSQEAVSLVVNGTLMFVEGDK